MRHINTCFGDIASLTTVYVTGVGRGWGVGADVMLQYPKSGGPLFRQLHCATGWGSTGEWSFSMDMPAAVVKHVTDNVRGMTM